MHDTFDVFEYCDFLRARWRFVAFACTIAIICAAAASLLLPKRYTSTATILIDPPADGDPRMATAVSTVYLESLKTYELLATNDQLFARAIERFHLRDHDSSPVETLKRRVLKVDKLRDTRALQISVTLPDPATAQAMAQFIANGTVELNRWGSREAGDVMIQDAAKAASQAKARLDSAGETWEKAAAASSEEALRSDIFSSSDLKSRIQEQLLDKQSDPGASRAQIELLERQLAGLSAAIDRKSAELARETALNASLEAAVNAARTAYEAAAQRLAELPVSLNSRSEWLRVLDPGIVPQRPSSPNVPLILIGSLSLALLGSLLYLTIAFGLARGQRTYHSSFRVASHGDD
jgi:uncharacterized protein involved in exopolysaccharide biosynthesis